VAHEKGTQKKLKNVFDYYFLNKGDIMFPGGMNPKQMGKMMKQMGIQNDDVDAAKVDILLKDGTKISFDNPSVQAMTVQGQKTYTITGEAKEEKTLPQEDIEMVMEQAKVSKEKAIAALEAKNGDIAEAIFSFQE
jgi:nascent polypeptide-associated complex subunit alpha